MTSVPPTQPLAAPETDVRLTAAERNALQDSSGAPGPLSRKHFEAVERIVAERVRVVEGERDALAEQWDDSGWLAPDEVEALTARAESAEAAHEEAEQHIVQLTESRDRAEHAHEQLQAAVEALADAAEARERASLSRTFDGGTFGAWVPAADLRALVAGGAR